MSPRAPIGLLLSLPCALWCASATATPFAVQTVDSLGSRGIHSSLALDSRRAPRVSYYGDGQILYASRIDTTWAIELVDSVGDVGYYTSLALSAGDVPHISYFDLSNHDIRYATKAPGYWVTEVVDSAGSVGQYGSIALDPSGNPAITYYDNTNGNLKYAIRTGGVWTTEIADSAGDVGFFTSLAFNGLGEPCVSYFNLGGGLKYARRTSAGWTNETIEIGAQAGGYTSLALDTSGRAHISYSDLAIGSLKYAAETPTGWSLEIVDATNGAGSFTSIELAGGTDPRISYIARGPKHLMYAARVGTFWQTEIVDSATQVDFFTSLDLDPEGTAKISYYDVGAERLKVADAAVRIVQPHGGESWGAGTLQKVTWAGIGPVDVYLSQDGGTNYTKVNSSPAEYHTVEILAPAWTTASAKAKVVRSSPHSSSESPGLFSVAPGLSEPWWTKPVDGNGLTGFTPSLKLTSAASPRISYWDTSTGSVRYAARVAGVWTAENVRSGIGSHTLSPLAINRFGVASVAYFNNSNNTLNYAARLNGTWTSEVVRTSTSANEYCSLALDPDTRPRIAYYESGAARLVLAARFGISWDIEDVDHGANVGLMNSLALDSLGYPYISYYDGASGNLKFASKTGPAWSVETIDTMGNVGAYTSLALDVAGNAHISYVDVTNRMLKYATNAGSWRIETVDLEGGVNGTTSISFNSLGIPRIAYHDAVRRRLKVATRENGTWRVETVVPAAGAASNSSLALDPDGNARLAYLDERTFDLYYASSAVELNGPAAGTVWPVGVARTVRWDGEGRVDISLSADSGATFAPLASGAQGGSRAIVVPAFSSSRCLLRIERALPYSVSVSDTFTIGGGIALLWLRADPSASGPGADVTWDTSPSLPDIAGYRLERARGDSAFVILLSQTTDKSYRDPSTVPGTRYRLSAINFLGGVAVLGEVEFRPRKPLAAGPLPYRGGTLAISFTAAGTGSAPVPTEVRLYDLRGRLVRTIARGSYAPGFQAAEWNGADERNRRVASGIYFLKSTSGGQETAIKIAVLR